MVSKGLSASNWDLVIPNSVSRAAMAALFGASKVNGPLPFKVVTRSAATTASTRMLRSGSAWASATKSVGLVVAVVTVVLPSLATLELSVAELPSVAAVVSLLLLPPQPETMVTAPRPSRVSACLRCMC